MTVEIYRPRSRSQCGPFLNYRYCYQVDVSLGPPAKGASDPIGFWILNVHQWTNRRSNLLARAEHVVLYNLAAVNLTNTRLLGGAVKAN